LSSKLSSERVFLLDLFIVFFFFSWIAPIDGACFGTTFPHLLLNTFQELREPFADRIYEPRIYGFRIHASAVNGPRMQWLRRGDPPPLTGAQASAKDANDDAMSTEQNDG
jgi:hypothetical protein